MFVRFELIQNTLKFKNVFYYENSKIWYEFIIIYTKNQI